MGEPLHSGGVKENKDPLGLAQRARNQKNRPLSACRRATHETDGVSKVYTKSLLKTLTQNIGSAFFISSKIFPQRF